MEEQEKIPDLQAKVKSLQEENSYLKNKIDFYNFILAFGRELVFKINKHFQLLSVWQGSHIETFYPREEFIGKSLSELFKPELSILFEKAISQCLETNKETFVEYKSPFPADEKYFKAIYTSYFDSIEEEQYVIARIQEITNTVKYENKLKLTQNHLQSLLRLSQYLEKSFSDEEIYKAVKQEISIIFGNVSIRIVLLLKENGGFTFLSITGDDAKTLAESFSNPSIKRDEYIKTLLAIEDIYIVEDASQHPTMDKDLVKSLDIANVIVLPMVLSENKKAYLSIVRKKSDGIKIPSEEEKKYFNALGKHISVALDRISLFQSQDIIKEELKERNKDLAKLNEEFMDQNIRLKSMNEIYQLQNIEYAKLNEQYEKSNIELLKAKENAEKSDKLKSVFLANMSHEIRTPMNSIIGFANLLMEEDCTDEEKRLYLSNISTSSNQLLYLVNDILDISKIESGLLRIVHKEVDIDLLLRNLYNVFQQEAHAKGLGWELEIPEYKNRVIVISDELRIRQILLNLLNNAIKFTTKGSVSFGYNIKSNEIEIFVRDTGIGIKDSDREVIFERFRQLDSGSERLMSGTGLGLAICSGLSKLLEGKIYLESEYAKGSTFYFSLPSC